MPLVSNREQPEGVMSMMAEEVQQHRGHRGRRHRGFAGGLFFAMETIFIALLAVTGISSCPRKCQCIWRDSKITVDCSDQELAAIPTTVEANTQVSVQYRAMYILTFLIIREV